MSKRAQDPSNDSNKKSRTPISYDDSDPKVGPLEAPFLKLFSAGTTNGQKVTILLELLDLEYIFRFTEFKNETKEEWYLKINPAGKIPVVEDVDSDGRVFTLAESGAILVYLAEKYDIENKFSYAPGTPEHYKEIEFLFFHASGLNPQQAGLNLTRALEPENGKNVERFTQGVLKSYQLVEDQLSASKSGFLVGDHISLADLIAFPHANVLTKSGIDITKFPNIVEWLEKINAIPQVQAALAKN
jgi:glutathione S-transferase